MSVLAMNAMAKAVVAPKVTASKPRASAFMGRPAAFKARVAGTSQRSLNACQKTMMKKKQMNLVPLLRNHHHAQISIDLLFPGANRDNNTSPPNQSIPRSPQGPYPGHRQGCLPDRGPEQETQRSHLHRL